MNEINLIKNYLNNDDTKKIDKIKIIPKRDNDDSNKYVFFVNFCLNLGVENYIIPKIDEEKTKMVAGKIVLPIGSPLQL